MVAGHHHSHRTILSVYDRRNWLMGEMCIFHQWCKKAAVKCQSRLSLTVKTIRIDEHKIASSSGIVFMQFKQNLIYVFIFFGGHSKVAWNYPDVSIVSFSQLIS